MDDFVFTVVGGARGISGLVAATAAIVYDEFHRHLLQKNMKQGKSEPLIVFGVRGSKEAENKLFRDDGGNTPFGYRGVELTLCHQVYKSMLVHSLAVQGRWHLRFRPVPPRWMGLLLHWALFL